MRSDVFCQLSLASQFQKARKFENDLPCRCAEPPPTTALIHFNFGVSARTAASGRMRAQAHVIGRSGELFSRSLNPIVDDLARFREGFSGRRERRRGQP